MSTGIEWTEATWNPVTGCDRISAGCDNCYALNMARRLKAMGAAKYQHDGDPRTSGPGFGVTTHPDVLRVPRRWRAPRLVFVNSMSDLFHARVPEAFVRDVFDVIRETPQHTYQVLTKRPLRIRRMADRGLEFRRTCGSVPRSRTRRARTFRIPDLLAVPAAVRFLSCEPLLGSVSLSWHLFPYGCPDGCGCRRPDYADRCECACGGACADWRPVSPIGWVIVGGESGPAARAMNPDWVRDLRDECVDADVPFFFKQWGGRTPKHHGRNLDGRTWNQMPTT
ncbi:DUF5131 family protein [Nocardia gipuzkoensis]|uniref:DUF5131 family protein n=1 Tax=Nocardia gipuzkoensis TaxID=2749991 RepID=UPI003EE32E89